MHWRFVFLPGALIALVAGWVIVQKPHIMWQPDAQPLVAGTQFDAPQGTNGARTHATLAHTATPVLISARPKLTGLRGNTNLPQARPRQAVWRPLSDVQRYRSIFALQTLGEWHMADTLIAELGDPALLGYVLYQRYTHPAARPPGWAQLHDWLNRYIELPVAWPIYKLAKARQPKSARLPQHPPERIYEFVPTAQKFFPDAKSRAIHDEVVRLCQKGYPTGARRFLSKTRTRQALSPTQRRYLTMRIIASYVALGHPQKAQTLAKSMLSQRADFPMIDWHMGFSAWRLAHMETAAYYFAALANNTHASLRARAKGAYWAARSYALLGRSFEARHYLAQASSAGVNFYSLLAQQRLSGRIQILWQSLDVNRQRLTQLKDYAAVTRALLLTRVAQSQFAEMELLRLLEHLPASHIPALQFLARREGYAGIELAATRKLKKLAGSETEQTLTPSQYPIAQYMDAREFLLDRALVYGLIRQESMFRLTAKSPAGARGLMQLMPATAAYVSGNAQLRKHNQNQLHNARTNLLIGQSYLRQLIQNRYRVGDNLIISLGAYNAGPGNMRRWRAKRTHLADPLTFLESLPANETRLYVTRVLENMWIYRNRLHQPAPSLVALAKDRWPVYQALDAHLTTTAQN